MGFVEAKNLVFAYSCSSILNLARYNNTVLTLIDLVRYGLCILNDLKNQVNGLQNESFNFLFSSFIHNHFANTFSRY